MLLSIKKPIKLFLYKCGLNPRDLYTRKKEGHIDEVAIVAKLFARKKQGTIIDVGFAWGDASLPFLLRRWSSHAFEPDTSPSKLRAISEFKSTFPNFHFSNRAVSNRDGESQVFYTSAESEGISSLHSFKNHKASHDIMTISLSSFVRRHNITSIDFLKIDVEGHDLPALQSLDFSKVAPSVVLVEFDDFKTRPIGYEHTDIGDFLLSQEYVVYMFEWYPIQAYGQQHRFRKIKKYPCSMVDPKGWGNFMAIRSELQPDLISILKSKYSKYIEV